MLLSYIQTHKIVIFTINSFKFKLYHITVSLQNVFKKLHRAAIANKSVCDVGDELLCVDHKTNLLASLGYAYRLTPRHPHHLEVLVHHICFSSGITRKQENKTDNFGTVKNKLANLRFLF